jgi:hypothetical protein
MAGASLDSEVEVLDVGEARAEARLGVVRDAVAAARRKGRAREGEKAGARFTGENGGQGVEALSFPLTLRPSTANALYTAISRWFFTLIKQR